MADVLDEIGQLRQQRVVDTAQSLGVRPELVNAVIQQESGGQANALSPKGAMGLMQVMPNTARNPGFGVAPFDPNDPQQNLHGGIAYLKALIDHFGGDETKALAAYNAGVGTVEKAGGVPNIPETQNYVARVQQNAGAPGPDVLSEIGQLRAAQAAKTPTEDDPSLMGFLGNVVQSGGNLLGGIAHTVMHPLDTAATVGKTAVGALELAPPWVVNSASAGVLPPLPGVGAKLKQTLGDQTAYAKALINFYKQRYGGVDNVKHTLYTDPVGAAADVASLFTGAGEALEGANVLSRSARLADIAEGLKNVGSIVDPIQGTLKAAAAVTQPLEKATGIRVANAYLKPKATLKADNPGFNVAEEVLKQGVNFTSKGLNTIKANLADLSEQYKAALATDRPTKYLTDAIDQALVDYAKEVSKGDMRDVGKVDRVRRNVLTENPNRSMDKTVTTMVPQPVQVPTGAVDAAGNPIMQTQMRLMPQQQVVGRKLVPQTAEQLDQMKRSLYKANEGKFGAEQPNATVEARKVAARATDSIIDQNVPGAKGLNDQRASAIIAQKALQGALRRHENTYPVGLMAQLSGLMAEGGFFAGLEGHPMVGAAMIAPSVINFALKTPAAASALARGMYGAGTARITGTARRVLQNITPATQVDQAARRPVTRSELDDKTDVLARLGIDISK